MPKALTQKVRGIPVYVWLVMLLVAIAIVMYVRRRNALANAAVEEEGEPGDTLYDDGGYLAPGTGQAGDEIGLSDLQGLEEIFTAGFDEVGNRFLAVETQLTASARRDRRRAKALSETTKTQGRKNRKVTRNQGKRTRQELRRHDERNKRRKRRKHHRPMTGGGAPRVTAQRVDAQSILSGRANNWL